MAYPLSDQLVKNESMDFKAEHASALTGKVRIMTFTFTADEVVADKAVTIAKLPAGRGRALPLLSYYKTSGVTGNVTIGTGSYTSSMPSDANTVDTVIAENKTALSASKAVSANNEQFSGSAKGVEYSSLEDVPVVLFGTTVPKGATIEGVLAYAVS